MRVTHLGHACLLLEYADARILVDPGNLSQEFETITDLSAILVTHQHPDHLDPQRFPRLAAANPQARILVEPETLSTAFSPTGPLSQFEARPLAAGNTVDFGRVTVAADGGEHAIIHEDLPQVGNIGLLLYSEGEPTLFHPGDSLTVTPQGVDVLAVPVSAPWCALKETVEFVRAVGAPRVIGIHDQVASEPGRQIYLGHIENLGGSQLVDMPAGEPREL